MTSKTNHASRARPAIHTNPRLDPSVRIHDFPVQLRPLRQPVDALHVQVDHGDRPSRLLLSLLSRLLSLYKSILPGDPLAPNTLLGPVHTRAAVGVYSSALDRLRAHRLIDLSIFTNKRD